MFVLAAASATRPQISAPWICKYALTGCTNPLADNYASFAGVTSSNGMCAFGGCNDTEAQNYNPTVCTTHATSRPPQILTPRIGTARDAGLWLSPAPPSHSPRKRAHEHQRLNGWPPFVTSLPRDLLTHALTSRFPNDRPTTTTARARTLNAAAWTRRR